MRERIIYECQTRLRELEDISSHWVRARPSRDSCLTGAHAHAHQPQDNALCPRRGPRKQQSVLGAQELDVKQRLFVLDRYQSFLQYQREGPLSAQLLASYDIHRQLLQEYLRDHPAPADLSAESTGLGMVIRVRSRPRRKLFDHCGGRVATSTGSRLGGGGPGGPAPRRRWLQCLGSLRLKTVRQYQGDADAGSVANEYDDNDDEEDGSEDDGPVAPPPPRRGAHALVGYIASAAHAAARTER